MLNESLSECFLATHAAQLHTPGTSQTETEKRSDGPWRERETHTHARTCSTGVYANLERAWMCTSHLVHPWPLWDEVDVCLVLDFLPFRGCCLVCVALKQPPMGGQRAFQSPQAAGKAHYLLQLCLYSIFRTLGMCLYTLNTLQPTPTHSHTNIHRRTEYSTQYTQKYTSYD